MAGRELFDLSILGGAPEREWRRMRPDIDALPWNSLSLDGIGEPERLQARREWTDAALQEYASAATFANLLRAMLRARVPLDLSAAVARFPLDEIAHAELCARMAGALGGGTPLAYDRDRVFAAPTAAEEAGDPELAATARIVSGLCVREAFSLAMMRVVHRAAPTPLHAALWSRVLDDEKHHGGFGWTFLGWIAPDLDEEARAQLARVAAVEIEALGALLDRVEAAPPTAYSRLGIVGPVGARRYAMLGRRALRDRVIRPLRRFGIDPGELPGSSRA